MNTEKLHSYTTDRENKYLSVETIDEQDRKRGRSNQGSFVINVHQVVAGELIQTHEVVAKTVDEAIDFINFSYDVDSYRGYGLEVTRINTSNNDIDATRLQSRPVNAGVLIVQCVEV